MESKIKERKKYYDNGQLWKQCFYRNGKLDGEFKSWYRNGQLIEHRFYRDGKLGGECKGWRENGQLYKQYFYNNGEREEYKNWYRNGQLETHRLYHNKEQEEFKSWYNNGQPQEHSFYCNGKLYGEFKQWYCDGQLYEHGFYKNGERVCDLNYKIIKAIVKFQRSFRISMSLKKYFNSREFVEWWYSPTVKGGLLAKQEILNTISEIKIDLFFVIISTQLSICLRVILKVVCVTY